MAKSKGRPRMYIVNSNGVCVQGILFEGNLVYEQASDDTIKMFKPVMCKRKIPPQWTIWSTLRELLQPGTPFSYN